MNTTCEKCEYVKRKIRNMIIEIDTHLHAIYHKSQAVPPNSTEGQKYLLELSNLKTQRNIYKSIMEVYKNV